MPTVNIKAFSHKKSTVVENGGPKLPTAAQLELGEIAINFAKGYETLSIKNNNDEIVTFTNDNYWINKELAIAAALNDLNDRKQDVLEMDEIPTEGSENVVTSGGLYSYITEIEQVTAAALNDLNDRITSLALSDDYAAAAQGTPPLAGDTYETAISKLHKVILDDELITSSALNDLNDRIDNLSLSEDYEAADPTSEPAGGDTYEVAISKLHGAILENELATAGALNDLNTRISDIVVPELILNEDYEPSSLSNEDLFLEPGDSYETAFAKLEKAINDNENITSAALTDLDSRLNLLHLPQSLDDIPDGSTRKLSDYATITSVNSSLATKQDTLVSGTNIKTINNESILGSGNITIQGGDTNVIETVKVNGTALTPDANKAVNITVPAAVTESTVSGWGFTKNTGTYSKPSGGIPANDLSNSVQTSLGKADTALQSFTESDPTVPSHVKGITTTDISNWNGKQAAIADLSDIRNGAALGATALLSYTETDPTVPAWAKASTKPTYTAQEVGALPNTYTPPVTSVNGQTGAVTLSIPNDSNLVHKTGNETISGTKTFGGSNSIKLSNTIERHVPELITGNTLQFDWIKIHADLTNDDLTLQQALDARNNVQADWNQTTTTAADYIKNKPTIPAAQIQADWNLTTTTSLDYIKNKPYIKSSRGGEPDSMVTNIGQLGTDSFDHYIYLAGRRVFVNTDNGAFQYNNKEVATKNDIPTNVSAFTNDAGYLTSYTETDPTVPAWAKAANKPSYTAAEVGALPDTYTPPVTSVNGQTGAVNLSIPDDSNLVHKTGNETIAGNKIFQSNIEIEAPGMPKKLKYNTLDENKTFSWIVNDYDGGTYDLQQALDERNNLVTSVNGQTGAVTVDVPVTSVNGQTGAVTITETQLSKGTETGAGNAVTDINVSNHEITLVKGATYATQSDIDTSIANLVDSAPKTLDTLNELAAALGDDPNFATTVANQIGQKYTKPNTGIPASDLAAGVIPAAPGTLNTTATTAQSTSSSEALSGNITLHKIAKTGSYNDLIGKPTIPTVNNATLTIQKNGTTVNTFTANASSNVTANIQVNELPTVSSSDNGKILQVVNGAWALVTPTSIYSGTSEPDSNTGNNGDLYLQTS